MDRDRNFLFGILAVQSGRITPEQSAAAGALWVADPSRSIGDYLVETKALSESDRAFVDRALQEAVHACGGDVCKALQSAGGDKQVQESFLGSLIVTESGHLCSTIPFLPVGAVRAIAEVAGVEEAPGRYTPIGEYGRGGMGRVLLVHDEHLGRQIALKELLPIPAPSGDGKSSSRLTAPMMARFLQEARITGQLEHPSIVPVYELGHRADGSLYYTMKLVRGRTMSQAIVEAQTLEERLRLLPHFIDLCNAIAYAHSRKVIHRDIKPGNVMVGEFGETVALDWGLAKSKDVEDVHAKNLTASVQAIKLGDEASVEKTTHGQAVGTPTYMPPEQALGQLDRVDERSDVYALGAALYELLSGQPPYTGETSKEVLKKVIARGPEDLRHISRHIPAELAAVCRKAMARNPADRYQSAKELAEEVERFQTGGLVNAYTYRVSDLARRVVQRYRAILITGTLAACALLALGVYAYASNRAAKIVEHGLRLESEQRLYSVSINLAQRHVNEGRIEVARPLLAQCPPELRHWEWGWLRYVCDATSTALPGLTIEAQDACFNKDGSRLLAICTGGDVVMWDVAAAREILRINTGAIERPAVAISPTGDVFASSGDEGSVKIWNAATGEPVAKWTGHDSEVHAICYSSDGKRVISGSLDGTVRIWDAATGETLHVLDFGETEVQSVASEAMGTRAAAACADGRVVVFDSSEGRVVHELRAHPTNLHFGVSGAIQVAFRPGHMQLASCGCDDTVKLWDYEAGDLLRTFRGHVQKVWSVTFSPDGATLVSASHDRKVIFWDPDTGLEKNNAIGVSSAVIRTLFSPDGTRLAIVGSTNARVWDAGKPLGAIRLRGHTADVNAVEFSLDGRVLASGAGHWSAGGDTRVILWDVASRKPLHILEGHTRPVFCIAFHPNGKWVTTSGSDHRVITWDIATGSKVREFSADVHTNGVRSIAYSPDGRQLISGGWDAEKALSAKGAIWDAASGTLLHTLEGHNEVIDSVDWSEDGRLVATACRDGKVRTWDPAEGALVSVLPADEDWAYGVAFDPRGARLAASYASGAVLIWDLNTGDIVQQMKGHTIRVNTVDYSADGERLMTCDNAGCNVWDSESAALLVSLQHGSLDIAMDRDMRTVATAGMDSDVIVWPALPWKGGGEGVADP
ncbi:MAG: protein kinase [Candidatus Hydrogenedentes bacterium]|nr:protein kinase [Candidatus Hydrogenedentota bacterium]